MISVISCSIKPDVCKKMLESVHKTIGTEYETLIFDNREKKHGICRVYNESAKKAVGKYLCFVHEDIIFKTNGWGQELVKFSTQNTDCGAIGVAGGKWANRNFISWYVPDHLIKIHDDRNNKRNYCENDLVYQYTNPNCEIFSTAVCIDGVFLFVKKDIWEKNLFDESTFKEFHFYDADFTFSISQQYQNYVYLDMDVYHFSAGNIERTYCENMYLFQKKWKRRLPYCLPGYNVSFDEEFKMANKVFSLYKSNGVSITEIFKRIYEINGGIFLVYLFLKFTKAIYRKIHLKMKKILFD